MRKKQAFLTALILLISMVIVFNGKTKAVILDEVFYNGDLILNDNNITIIEDKIFRINGSIIVEENATLIIRNSLINFTQTSNQQFNMTFKNPINGNPRLIVENATITGNGYVLNVYFRDAFQKVNMATLDQLVTIGNIRFYFWHDASAQISNSELFYVNIQHDTTIEISNCTIDTFDTGDSTRANITDSEISLIRVHGNSIITIKNCTINHAEIDTYAKCYIYDSTINEGYALDSSRVWLFNTTTTGTGDVNDTAIVYIGWYLDIHVTDFAGENIPGANVTAYYANDTIAESKLTGTHGWARLTLIEGFVNGTDDFNWIGTYTVMTYYNDLTYSNITWVDLYENIELEITLGLFLHYPAYYNGDIVLKNNKYLYIEGLLNINGSIIVEDYATLLIYNGWINFTQTSSYQFNMHIRDYASLLCFNGYITGNNHPLMISFENNSTATISELTSSAGIQFMHYSIADVQDSDLQEVAVLHFAITHFENCTINNLHASGNTECTLYESEINDYMGISIDTANATITDLAPGMMSVWSFMLDCSVKTNASSYVPNITIADSFVNDWELYIYGYSHVKIFRSTLKALTCDGASETNVYDSILSVLASAAGASYCHFENTVINLLLLSDSSEVWAFNTTVNGVPTVLDNAQLYVGWHLDVHVTDSLGTDISGANVSITNADGFPVAYGQTQPSGWIRFPLLEKLVNATGEYPYGTYTVEATYDEHSDSQPVTMNGNQIVEIQLPFIIPEHTPLTLLLTLLTTAAAMVYLTKKRT